MEETIITPENTEPVIVTEGTAKQRSKKGVVITSLTVIIVAALLAICVISGHSTPRSPLASNHEEFKAYLSKHFPDYVLAKEENGVYIYEIPSSIRYESYFTGILYDTNAADTGFSFSTGGTLTVPVTDYELTANGWTNTFNFGEVVNEKGQKIKVLTFDGSHSWSSHSYITVYPQDENAPRFTTSETIKNSSTLMHVKENVGSYPYRIVFYENGYEEISSGPAIQLIYGVFRWEADAAGNKAQVYQYINTGYLFDAVKNVLLEITIGTAG